MDKRIAPCFWYGAAGLVMGLLSYSRWGVLSLMGFFPTELCNPEIADRFFDLGGIINHRIVEKIDRDADLLSCAFDNAVKYQSLSSLQPLIDSGADVNTRDEKGMTPLFYTKSKQTAQLLIDNGADVEAKNKIGKMPLFYAHNKAIAQLLVNNGADVNARDRNKETPLFSQVDDIFDSSGLFNEGDEELYRFYHLEVIEFLIKKGADINVKNASGRTPLFFARNKAVAQLLIDNGADTNIKAEDTNDVLTITPLFSANTKEIAQLLIDNGADVDAKNSNGKTPLFHAISFAKDKGIAQVLLDNSADVDAKNNYGDTPLLYLIRQASTVLLDRQQYESILQLLIDNGADVNVRDRHGNTPLLNLIPTARNNTSIEMLINSGADVNARNKFYQTPLLQAVEKNLFQYLDESKLIERGFDIQEVEASLNARTKELIKMLIDRGADVNAKDKYGKTPLSALKNYFKHYSENVKAYPSIYDNDYFQEQLTEKKKIEQLLIGNGAIK